MSGPTGPDRDDRVPRQLVLGGIGMRRGPAPLTWRSDAIAAVAEVLVPIGTGVTVTVDAADPATVLAWSLDPAADAEGLEAACTGDMSALVASVRAGSSPPTADRPRLRPEWARCALVTAVSQRFPAPVHEGALLLDAAAADQRVGATARAAATVGWALPALSGLAAACFDDRLTDAAATTLTEVARLCAAAVDGMALAPEVAAIADRLAERAAVADAELQREILDFLSREGISELAYNLGGSREGDATALIDEELDLLAVPPRILRWEGAREPEIRVERASRDMVRVCVPLAADVDPRCREVGALRAYAADGRDGGLRATASLQVHGRILFGHLRFADSLADPVFGVYSADLGAAAIRTDATGRALRGVDRLMIDAWSSHRSAIATAASADPLSPDEIRDQLTDRVQGLLGHARSLASAAADRLDALAERVVDGDPSLADRLDARLTAVESYLLELDGPATGTEPGLEPLLAEQVSADFEEGDGQ